MPGATCAAFHIGEAKLTFPPEGTHLSWSLCFGGGEGGGALSSVTPRSSAHFPLRSTLTSRPLSSTPIRRALTAPSPAPPPQIHSLPLPGRGGEHSDRAGLSRLLEPRCFPDRGPVPDDVGRKSQQAPAAEPGARARGATAHAQGVRGGACTDARQAAGSSACARGAARGWRYPQMRCSAVSSAGVCPCGCGTVDSNFPPSSGRD